MYQGVSVKQGVSFFLKGLWFLISRACQLKAPTFSNNIVQLRYLAPAVTTGMK